MGRGEPALLQLVRSARTEGPQRLPDVRPPDGRAPTLTRSLMRAARTATLLFILALLAGCGGSKSDYEEVPGPPASVTIPSDSSTLDDSAGADASPTATPTGTATPE